MAGLAPKCSQFDARHCDAKYIQWFSSYLIDLMSIHGGPFFFAKQWQILIKGVEKILLFKTDVFSYHLLFSEHLIKSRSTSYEDPINIQYGDESQINFLNVSPSNKLEDINLLALVFNHNKYKLLSCSICSQNRESPWLKISLQLQSNEATQVCLLEASIHNSQERGGSAFTSLAPTKVVKNPGFTGAELIPALPFPSSFTPVKFDESRLACSGSWMWKFARAGVGSV
ncbi:unnamed protein product [Lupinus luteus]|uniref:Uncharacterized protein n=1 Tax=Lupinus luteus TaxID=3873 RepID=A0AAV1WFY6_LUPLU